MAASESTTSGDRTQPELFIGNLPRRTKSQVLKSEIERHGVHVLRCQIRKPRSKRPYAFVRVASRADCDRALRCKLSMMLGGRLLTVAKSVRGGQRVITEPIDLEIHQLQSFSIGVFFLKQSMFLQRWSSLDGNNSIAGDIKCTVNFRKGEIHLCFMTDEHEYKVQFFFKDMQYFLDLRAGNLPSDVATASSRCVSHGLVLAFLNAPLVFRKDRDVASRKTAASELATSIVENPSGSHYCHNDVECDDDDDEECDDDDYEECDDEGKEYDDHNAEYMYDGEAEEEYNDDDEEYMYDDEEEYSDDNEEYMYDDEEEYSDDNEEYDDDDEEEEYDDEDDEEYDDDDEEEYDDEDDEEYDDDEDPYRFHAYLHKKHRLLDFLEKLEFGADVDDGEDLYHADNFFLAGDVEEEGDWRRTTGTFTQDPNIQGQYFHYLLTPQCEQEFEAIIKRMREKYNGYVHYDARIRRLTSKGLLRRDQYAKLASRVPFQLMFLVEAMVGDGLLYRELMSELFFELLKQPNAYRCLRHYQQRYCYYLDQYGEVMEDPAEDFLKSIDLIHEGRNVGNSPKDDFAVDCSTDDHIMVHHATITPLLIYCYGPYLDTANRVLRHYKHLSDRFLRVNFADEHREKLNVGKASRPLTEITDFIRKTLSEGIDVAGRHYEFLAMSNSQLRENSCWFFSSETEARRPSVTAADIRNWMGDFSNIKNVAKYAARMGQCFSCTSTSGKLTVDGSEFKEVRDVKTRDGKYTFSDGIGMISPSFAKEAALVVPNLKGGVPSAFQIRFAGYKGMVAVNPDMEAHLKLQLRPSMRKFESKHLQLEVIQASRLLPGHLNRQIILLLSTLGIDMRVFIDLQKKMTSKLDDCVRNEQVAMNYIAKEHCLSDVTAPTTLLHTMMKSGVRFPEPFLEAMMLAYRNSRLAMLEEKARIFVEDAACLHGVLDESGFLDYGEVYICIRDNDGLQKVITGPVAVAKNPCLHPGDVRVLMAMAAPTAGHSLHMLENCLVFPRRGVRPHPDECSGSDLDGDTYFVTWNPHLIPTQVQPPMEYAGKQAQEVDRVTMEHIYDFFVKYMQNDSLGVICNSHLALADLSDQSANDPVCLELAQMQSDAVDYPKTGVPVEYDPKRHSPATYPDFMKKRDKEEHTSKKVLGRLFHDVHQFHKKCSPQTSGRLRIEHHRDFFDADLNVAGHEEFDEEARLCKTDYDAALRMIMNKYQLKKEEEAVGGFFIKLPRSQRQRSLHDIQQKVRQEATRLRQHYLDEEFGDVPEKYRGGSETAYLHRKASAWYTVTYHPHYTSSRGDGSSHSRTPRKGYRPELVSFAWIPYQYLCAIKKEKRMQKQKLHVGRH
ncbi:uncharacterized protein LOC135804495 [Sycon ciliatum]|uniref:uncharacterized protein LOC135804495 n=1 Tax=Sycon ciliatum TaxID=27933 RepID=UPI0031F617D0